MAKGTTVGARVDEELKEKATEAFEKMGIPLSLGIEMFLKNVVENECLPFPIVPRDNREKERQQQLEDFWRTYIIWNFQVYGAFDYPKAAQAAKEKYGYSPKPVGTDAAAFISKQKEADGHLEAAGDIERMRALLGDAKEMIYWALGMDKAFVPSLAGIFAEDADRWRLEFTRLLKKRGIYGIAKDGTEIPKDVCDLDDDELFDLLDKWLCEPCGNKSELALICKLAGKTDNFDDVREALRIAGLEDDFDDYVDEILAEWSENDEQKIGSPLPS